MEFEFIGLSLIFGAGVYVAYKAGASLLDSEKEKKAADFLFGLAGRGFGGAKTVISGAKKVVRGVDAATEFGKERVESFRRARAVLEDDSSLTDFRRYKKLRDEGEKEKEGARRRKYLEEYGKEVGAEKYYNKLAKERYATPEERKEGRKREIDETVAKLRDLNVQYHQKDPAAKFIRRQQQLLRRQESLLDKEGPQGAEARQRVEQIKGVLKDFESGSQDEMEKSFDQYATNIEKDIASRARIKVGSSRLTPGGTPKPRKKPGPSFRLNPIGYISESDGFRLVNPNSNSSKSKRNRMNPTTNYVSPKPNQQKQSGGGNIPPTNSEPPQSDKETKSTNENAKSGNVKMSGRKFNEGKES